MIAVFGNWGCDLHLVFSMVSATTDDVDGTVALGRDGVLAHILEPDELEGAGTETVDALALVRATEEESQLLVHLYLGHQPKYVHDHIAERGTILKHEHSVGLATLTLAVAGTGPSIVSLPSTVELLASTDVHRLAEGLAARGLRNTALIRQTGEGCWHGGEERQDSC